VKKEKKEKKKKKEKKTKKAKAAEAPAKPVKECPEEVKCPGCGMVFDPYNGMVIAHPAKPIVAAPAPPPSKGTRKRLHGSRWGFQGMWWWLT
jgi:hypothetical protein